MSLPEAPPVLSPPPQPSLRRILTGDDGLRAGWSVLLFLIFVIALGAAASGVLRHFHLLTRESLSGHQITPRTTALGDLLQFAVVALAALLMSVIERRPFSGYGLTLRRMVPDFFAGLAWGLLLLSLLIAALYATHALAFDGLALHGRLALRFGLQWLGAFLCVGLAEEFVTRGYIQFTVTRGVAGITRALDPANRHPHAIGFWISAFLFSVCFFMSGHLFNPGETPWGIAAVGLAGVVFAFSLWRTGSLWWAIGIHTSWDWAQTCLYGTSDSGLVASQHIFSTHPIGPAWLSGAATGPEGSVLVIPTLLLVGLVIHLTLPRRNYPLTPDQSSLPADPTKYTQAIDEHFREQRP